MRLTFIFILLFGSVETNGQTFTDSNLPIVVIETENGVPIPDAPRVVANMGVIDNGVGVRNYLSDPYTNYDGRIEIEIRGSTSQQYPKKGYGFETQDALGVNLEVGLLGMPVENDWILYGPYPDKTLTRNVLTFDIARKMGNYASATRYCELMINGDYRGVYVMMERIKRDDNRVNLQNLHNPGFWDDTITGGYILKVDKLTGEVGSSWVSNYNNEVLFQFHDPEYDELYPPQISYLQDYMDEFEDVLWGSNYNDPVDGYSKYIDVQSFYDFFILQELGRTVDGYRSSSFLHKDKNALTWDAKLRAGPMWDFNLSFGNADYCQADGYTGWQYNFDEICGSFTTSIPFWWERLLGDETYRNGLRCRWETLRDGPLRTENINNFIDSVANHLEEARIRNFQRWPIIGVYVNWNGFVGQTYEEDLDFLKFYIEQRSLWIDANLEGICDLSIETVAQEPQLHRAWPNPVEDELYIGFTLLEPGNTKIEIVDLQGKTVISSPPSFNQSGKQLISFDVNTLKSGVYFYRIYSADLMLYTGKIIKP